MIRFFILLILIIPINSTYAQVYEHFTQEDLKLGKREDRDTIETFNVLYKLKTETVEIVDFPTREGNRAIKFYDNSGTVSHRAEISDKNFQISKNANLWYGWSLYPTWTSGVQYVGQWRISNLKDDNYPNRRCITSQICGNNGQQSGSGWHLLVKEGHWLLNIAHQKPTCADCEGSTFRYFDLGPVSINIWTDFVLYVKFTGNDDGFCKVWRQTDGGGYQLELDYIGRTWYNKFQDGSKYEDVETWAPNMTVGLYYGRETATTLYADEIRIAKEQAGICGFNQVRPDQKNSNH